MPVEPEVWPRLFEHLAVLPDPRDGPAIQHKFVDIVIIAICAAICGADD